MTISLRALRSRGSAIVLAGTLALGPATVLAASAPAAVASPAAVAARASAATVAADVGTVCKSALPSQADDTLNLIATGGPYPYPEDGEVYQNYEGVLPSEPSGYYHSYTVVTPGVSTRGARRVITAQDGTDYYTADHYTSFSRIDFSC